MFMTKPSHIALWEALNMLTSPRVCIECKNTGFVDIESVDDLKEYFNDNFFNSGKKDIYKKCMKIYRTWKKYGYVECLECI